MSNIFISHCKEDRDRILPLVNALKIMGWSVSWDRTNHTRPRCAILAILLVAYALPGLAQKLLTLNDISDLLKNGVRPDRIAQLVEEHGVGFELDDRALRRLKQDGANETLLAAVKKMSFRYTEERQQVRRQQEEETRRKREEEGKRREEQKRQQAKLTEPARKAEEARSLAPNYATVRVFFATDRKRISDSLPANMFGFDRGSLSYGTCEVSIPRDHRMGALEGPSVLRFEFRQDPERHIMLLSVSLLDKSKYFADLSVRIKKSVKKDAFIFVHGYNVTFADAARRTAQMAYDLGFAGAPVFYSWPSQGSLLRYTVDEANNEWTQSNLKQFLDDFTSETDAENIFLIGHGMGNRALTRAFGQLITEKPTLRNRFREVILSAPDIDAEVFKRDIVPKIVPATLYASSTDEALTRSKKFRQYARAGDAGPGLVIVEGIDTIDATNVATDFLGRSYFAESRSVISDLFYLIKDGKRAQDRFGLVETNTAVGRYWVFKR